MSTMAEMRSAVPSHRTGTSTGAASGLPSSATTLNVCPGSARLRISVALPLTMCNSTRSPAFTRIGSSWPSMRPLMENASYPTS